MKTVRHSTYHLPPRGSRKVSQEHAVGFWRHLCQDDEPAPVDRHQSITWAERLKRVFNIDITICIHCSGAVRVIACIDDPSVIKKILAHLDAKSGGAATVN